jgi:hypothetical protein
MRETEAAAPRRRRSQRMPPMHLPTRVALSCRLLRLLAHRLLATRTTGLQTSHHRPKKGHSDETCPKASGQRPIPRTGAQARVLAEPAVEQRKAAEWVAAVTCGSPARWVASVVEALLQELLQNDAVPHSISFRAGRHTLIFVNLENNSAWNVQQHVRTRFLCQFALSNRS